jgi:ferredoxin
VTVRVDVDRGRCEGHGLCEQVAPELFELDDDAMVQLRHDPVPEDLAGTAERAVGMCPVAALRLRPVG